MSETREHSFPTPRPVELYVDVLAGDVTVTASRTDEATVAVSGKEADQVRVHCDAGRLEVVGPRPRTGFLGGNHRLTVRVEVPEDSSYAVRTGSADVALHGRLGTGVVRTGSGDVRVDEVAQPVSVETGSGDVRVDTVAAGVRVKCGSGDVHLGTVSESATVSTGSGDVLVELATAPVAVKTGSGDVRVVDSEADVSLSTGSGDLGVERARRGRFTVKGASGDVRLGIPRGTPVWTDISTLSGRVHSDLEPVGEPAAGQDYVELRAKTASGSVSLTQT